MHKFDTFWNEILEKYENAIGVNVSSKIPDFEKFFKSLDKDEKKNFKPLLKILAHSLQFLDKLQMQNSKLDSLRQELKTSSLSADSENTKLLEKQILKLQNTCKEFVNSEEAMSKQLNLLQSKNSELEEDLNRAAKDIVELK